MKMRCFASELFAEVVERGAISGLNRPTNTELLDSYLLLKAFCFKRPELAIRRQAQFRSLLARFDALTAILGAHRSPDLNERQVRELAENIDHHTKACLQCHVDAYGTVGVIPKYHWLQHIGRQLQDDGMLLSSFPIERLHRYTKQVAKQVTNTRRFEKTVLNGMLVRHGIPPRGDEKVPLRGRRQDVGQHTLYDICDMEDGTLIGAGDFVIHDGRVSQVMGFYTSNGDDQISAALQTFDAIEKHTHLLTARQNDAIVFKAIAEWDVAVACKRDGDLVTIIPPV
jgi:hypothetical protein